MGLDGHRCDTFVFCLVGAPLYISKDYHKHALHFQSAVAACTDNVLQLVAAPCALQLLHLSCALLLVPAQGTTIVAFRFVPAWRFTESIRAGRVRRSCQEGFAGASEPGANRNNKADQTGKATQATGAKAPSGMGQTELKRTGRPTQTAMVPTAGQERKHHLQTQFKPAGSQLL